MRREEKQMRDRLMAPLAQILRGLDTPAACAARLQELDKDLRILEAQQANTILERAEVVRRLGEIEAKATAVEAWEMPCKGIFV